jgi:hypothetical protein
MSMAGVTAATTGAGWMAGSDSRAAVLPAGELARISEAAAADATRTRLASTHRRRM